MNQDNGGIIGKINTPTTSLASGVWSLDSQFDSQSSSIWPLAFPNTTIANACRFDDGSGDYLNRTLGTATDQSKYTMSLWIKKTELNAGDYQTMMGGKYQSTVNGSGIFFNTSNQIEVYQDFTSTNGLAIRTNRLFRDVSAWYHIVLNFDYTQSGSDKMKLYINGVEETSFETDARSSLIDNPTFLANSKPFTIGGRFTPDLYFNGYMAEVVLVDGQQLLPTSFGAFNPVTNIWEPIAYAGTYGTNGFRLDFADSSALGNDVSGNDNDFTANNLTSIDQASDTCSNNFATLNPLEAEQNSPTFSDGNLTQTTPNSGGTSGRSTIEVPHSGVWYWEVKIVSTTGTISDNVRLGISTGSSASDGQNLRYMSNGQYVNPSGASSYGASYAAGDIIGIKVDADSNQVTFYKNGASQGAISYTMVAGETYKAFVGEYSNTIGCVYSMNFGNAPFSISSGNNDPNGYGNFEYSTDSGYALNTKNLAEFGG